MLIPKLPKVKILDEIETEKYPWCDSALIFSVKNGKGSLTHTVSAETEECEYYSQLLLENKPILQGKYSISPTCTGLLAAGYGIENIDCPELKAVRENINGDFKDIRTSAEMLSPFLGLLDDGVYALADVPHYPADGEGNFFYHVSAAPVGYSAVCDSYYLTQLFAVSNGFPAYLFPTQSAELINTERVEEYVKILQNGSASPRGLAYYEKGFMSALLDGHHKACAAARLGRQVSCLTIIGADSFEPVDQNDFRHEKTPVKSVFFSHIKYPAKKGRVWEDYCHFSDKRELTPPIPEYTVTDREFPEEQASAAKNYPTAENLAAFYALDFYEKEMTEDDILKCLNSCDSENSARLKYYLAFLMLNDREKAYELARRIVRSDDGNLPQREAWKALLEFKTDETEQLMIDYIVSHTKSDRYWDIVTSYWDRVEPEATR